MDDHRPPLTYPEGARYLRISERTLHLLVAEHRVPYVRIGVKLIRFLPDELDAWLREHSDDGIPA